MGGEKQRLALLAVLAAAGAALILLNPRVAGHLNPFEEGLVISTVLEDQVSAWGIFFTYLFPAFAAFPPVVYHLLRGEWANEALLSSLALLLPASSVVRALTPLTPFVCVASGAYLSPLFDRARESGGRRQPSS